MEIQNNTATVRSSCQIVILKPTKPIHEIKIRIHPVILYLYFLANFINLYLYYYISMNQKSNQVTTSKLYTTLFSLCLRRPYIVTRWGAVS